MKTESNDESKKTLEERIMSIPIVVSVENVLLKKSVVSDVRDLIDCLDGCLHFSDAFVNHGIIGDALMEWRSAARSVLVRTTNRKAGERS